MLFRRGDKGKTRDVTAARLSGVLFEKPWEIETNHQQAIARGTLTQRNVGLEFTPGQGMDCVGWKQRYTEGRWIKAT